MFISSFIYCVTTSTFNSFGLKKFFFLLFQKTTESYNRVLIFRLVSNAGMYGLAGIREKISGLSDSNMDQLCNTISMNALTDVSVSFPFLHI